MPLKMPSSWPSLVWGAGSNSRRPFDPLAGVKSSEVYPLRDTLSSCSLVEQANKFKMGDPASATNKGMNQNMKGWFIEDSAQWCAPIPHPSASRRHLHCKASAAMTAFVAAPTSCTAHAQSRLRYVVQGPRSAMHRSDADACLLHACVRGS